MTSRRTRLSAVALALPLAFGVAACAEEENAVDEVEQGVEEGAGEVEQGAEDAGQEVEQGAEEAEGEVSEED